MSMKMSEIKKIYEQIKPSMEVLEFVKVGSALHKLETPTSDTDVLVLLKPSLYEAIAKKPTRSHIKLEHEELEFKEMDLLHAVQAVLSAKDIEVIEVAFTQDTLLHKIFKTTELTKLAAYKYLLYETLLSEMKNSYMKLCNVSGKVDMEALTKDYRHCKEFTKALRRHYQLNQLKQGCFMFSQLEKETTKKLLDFKTSKREIEEIAPMMKELYEHHLEEFVLMRPELTVKGMAELQEVREKVLKEVVEKYV